MKPSPFMGERHDLVNVEPGNPDPGDFLIWPVPTNAVVQIVSLKIALLTNGTVADRHVSVYSQDGSVFLPRTPAAIVQPADKAWVYYFTIGIAPLDLSADMDEVYQPFGCCYQLETGSSLIVAAKNIQGTDNFLVPAIRYLHWDRA